MISIKESSLLNIHCSWQLNTLGFLPTHASDWVSSLPPAQVKSKLKGHSKRITGLAFSHVLNVLVSSRADAQVHLIRSCSYVVLQL
ncbi:putative transcription factor WD40-like family [Rosa chinensis]|uniref:Putative transcription factor WD40-like family n=1 Tax=Rosa chinensis TaxID=74649 RepID=A0A2P6QV12_ROSCH|nr:putative transcription factor WD40-like family [Rosa chinensis]